MLLVTSAQKLHLHSRSLRSVVVTNEDISEMSVSPGQGEGLNLTAEYKSTDLFSIWQILF